MEIRKASLGDMPEIQGIYEYARSFMKQTGNPDQWKNNRPSMDTVRADIEKGNLYIVVKGTERGTENGAGKGAGIGAENGAEDGTENRGEILACFAMIFGADPTYDVIRGGQWLNDREYAVIHRVASNGKEHGILEAVLKYAEGRADNLRMDTHRDNKIMQHLLTKHGFRYCGIIITDDGTERLAYQRTGACPA